MPKLLPIIAAISLCATAAMAQSGTQGPTQAQIQRLNQAQIDPDAITASVNAPLPQRETDYIRLVEKARKQYAAAKSVDARKYARVDMQIAMHSYMGLSHNAKEWVGVFKASTKTQEGTMSLAIEIAPGVTIATWENSERDKTYNTLIRPFSPIAKVIDSLSIGDAVVFSGSLLGAVITNDDDMVLRPQVVAQFDTVMKLAQGATR